MSRPSRDRHAPPDPRRLDVADFARQGLSLSGAWPLRGFTRLLEGTAEGEDQDGGGETAVRWSAQGSLVPVCGGEPAVWLHLRAEARVSPPCQRCLQPVAVDVLVDRDLRFVPDDDQAAALDAELEEDVLALTRSLDLHELVEDELLLALPLVPRHERCPEPVRLDWPESEAAPEAPDRPNPFAALEALKRRPS